MSQRAIETPQRTTQDKRLASMLGVSSTERPATRLHHQQTRDGDENNETREVVLTYYPCYQWEESEEHLRHTASDSTPKAMMSTAYGHAMTRIQGKEGILPDTGAVHSLTGSRFVRAQGELARQHGAEVKWS